MSDRPDIDVMAEPYLVIAGASAVGKSGVALAVAERLGGEIVIADSRQVYRGLDIGTAKPTLAERRRVPHHLVDTVELGVRYTAGDYARDARDAIAAIQRRGGVAVVCGGTGFYLTALAGGLDAIDEGAGPSQRVAARDRLAGIPAAERHAALAELDPDSALRLAAGDRQRVDRALEVYFLTGRPLSDFRRGGEPPPPHLAIRLVRSRTELHRRIEERLEAMLEAGLEEEARRLYEAGWTAEAPGLDTIGYREWWPLFEGRRGRGATIREIQAATRAYARRQETWFRHQGSYLTRPPSAAAVLDAWHAFLAEAVP
ncbi:MAG: tRNA (adenosine(37)-N6)-dimethylallyltransferase MiaA [Gemmatimonadota bacterium]